MKKYVVKHRKQFVNKIMSLEDNAEIARKLGVNPTLVSSWTIDTNPSSANIEKILEVYELSCDDLGVKAYEFDVENKSFKEKLKQLRKEFKISQEDLGKSLGGFKKSTISKWENGENTPPQDTLIKIARYFDVDYEYLIGNSPIRRMDNEQIFKSLKCSEELINLIKNDSIEGVRKFLGMEYTAGELGEEYFDLKDYIYGDVTLLTVLKDEVDRIITYCRSDEYYEKYEELVNYKEVESQAIGCLNSYPIHRMAHDNIHLIIDEVFDRYVNKELISRNLGTNLYDTINRRGIKYLENKKSK